jgi:hypothetical protein
MQKATEINHQQVQRIIVRQSSEHHSRPSNSLSSLLINKGSQTISVGVWRQEEAEKLVSAVKIYGNKDWKKCSDFIGSRTPKQCRDKWIDCLQPDIKKTSFQEWEDQLIIIQHQIIGNKWSMIASSLPGRTSSSVKNRWYSNLSKRKADMSKEIIFSSN